MRTPGVFAAEATALRTALHRHIPGSQERLCVRANERDVVAAIWPCEWSSPEEEAVRRVFNAWWHTTRCPNGVYNPERLWTYFPVGEAHNYLLLGQRERAWQTHRVVLCRIRARRARTAGRRASGMKTAPC